MIRYLFITFILPLLLSMSGGVMALDPKEDDFELKLLGKHLFFDNISFKQRQSCSSCHTPDAGWTNGNSRTNKRQVAVTGANRPLVGTLKPPSNAYASFSANLVIAQNPFTGLQAGSGGNFWNGRATGTTDNERNVSAADLAYPKYEKYLGPTADQAHASPFINPVEQALPDINAVCEHVESATYAPLYKEAYGAALNCISYDEDEMKVVFARFAVALAAYQHSSEVNAFDSKRDRALKKERDKAFPLKGLTDQENLGHDLFYGVKSDLNPDGKNANCAAFCHRSGDAAGLTMDERYTSDGYFNIGTPPNPEIPGYPIFDSGLKATSGFQENLGQHKVPTLRNVDKRRNKRFIKAYTHNGWFKSLESLVHFYNTRDSIDKGVCVPGTKEKDALKNNCWPAPEFVENEVGFPFIGNLGLEKAEEAALVAYLKALTDIPTPKALRPFNLKNFLKMKPAKPAKPAKAPKPF